MPRKRKPTFSELIRALSKLVNTNIEREWLSASVGGWEESQVFLGQIVARTSDPVVRMLAEMAMKAR